MKILNQQQSVDISTAQTENSVIKEQLMINNSLPSEDILFCQTAVSNIKSLLSDKTCATMMGQTFINLTEAKNDGLINIARIDINRKPKEKSIKALKETILEVGPQIMLLVIPADVAVKFGYTIIDFDGNAILEDEMNKTVVIIDGQTRYSGYLEIKKENPDKIIPDLYAYFPQHWVPLDKMLQAINLKVFTWKNSDYMSGVLSKNKIDDETKKAFKYIRKLESKGYNYTSACEWTTLTKGIVKKIPLIKAMNEENSLAYLRVEFGIQVHKAIAKRFAGENEKILKRKTLPELIITKYDLLQTQLNLPQTTSYIIAFIENLSQDEINEIVSPSSYKRGGEKKKEDLIKEQFQTSFKKFESTTDLNNFKL